MPNILDKIISKYKLETSTPGFSVLIKRGNDVIYSRNIGAKDTEPNPIASESNFRLASITKQFTAASILQLVEKGKLSLNTKLTDIFPDFPKYGNDIAIHHLLNHTSGIRDYELDLDMIDEPQVSDKQVLFIAKQKNGGLFKPGSSFSYSNGAYCILACIIEKVTGMSFGEYLQENIFSRSGMKNTCLNNCVNIPNRAYGFSKKKNSEWFLNDQDKTSATQGDGGIYSSIEDLALWQESLYKNKSIISDKYLDLMTFPHIELQEDGGSGYGIFIININDQTCYCHAGESVGFRNAMFYFPDQEISLIILSNLDGVDMLEIGKEMLKNDFYNLFV